MKQTYGRFVVIIDILQCNEGRAEDAPAADLPSSTAPASAGRRASEAGTNTSHKALSIID